MKVKIKILLVFLLIILSFFLFINKNIRSDQKDKYYLRLVYLIPESTKTFLKENIFFYHFKKELKKEIETKDKKINRFIVNFEHLQREGDIQNIFFDKDKTLEINLGDESYQLEKYKTDFLITSKNIDARGSSYLAIDDKYLYVISATGIISYINLSNLVDQKRLKFKIIKNNIKKLITYTSFYKDSKYGIKDAEVINGRIYISYTNQVKKNCYNISILSANLRQVNLEFEKFFEPKDCVKKNSSFISFNPHHSGGRIVDYNDEFLLLSTGDFKNLSKAQDPKSSLGKILMIDKKTGKNKILASGLRNPQGLYYDKNKKALVLTDHGPSGGDEVNFIQIKELDQKINFGWPVVSYGEHYGFKSKDEKNLLYKKAPLYKSHSKYGYIEPKKYFTPGIGISEIDVFKNLDNYNSFIFGSMGDKPVNGKMSLHIIQFDEKNNLIKHNFFAVDGRIRDLIFDTKKEQYYIFLETGPHLAILKKKK